MVGEPRPASPARRAHALVCRAAPRRCSPNPQFGLEALLRRARTSRTRGLFPAKTFGCATLCCGRFEIYSNAPRPADPTDDAQKETVKNWMLLVTSSSTLVTDRGTLPVLFKKKSRLEAPDTGQVP